MYDIIFKIPVCPSGVDDLRMSVKQTALECDFLEYSIQTPGVYIFTFPSQWVDKITIYHANRARSYFPIIH